ncbi:MAG: fructose PTS transporter subunit IIA [Bacteroidota bacterium]|nr:fructose PTS transporter subunit IIA [Candidatus Kapabacteria bacterium]MDW8219366.1 fructose PTS transporter subunit IIA [Bacteroidota bacterium]
MRITDVLSVSSVAVHKTLPSKSDALHFMIEMLSKHGTISDPSKVEALILERESIMSTGVGKGFAFPHAKTDAVSRPVGALLMLDEPVEYQALDNKPVNIIFMLLGQENAVGTHLRLLSRVSRLMSNDEFRERLLKANSAAEAIEIIREEEEQKLDI